MFTHLVSARAARGWVAVAVLTVLSLGAAYGQGQASSPKAQALRPHEIQQRPLTWPEKVKTTVPLSDGRNEIKEGTEVELYAVQPGGTVVAPPGAAELQMLEFDMTDFVERANARAAELPEDLRSLTLDDLLTRADLLPPVVRSTEDVQFPDKNRAKGTEIGAYRVVRQSGGYVLAALDPELAKKGEFSQRQAYTLEQTDFLKQLRAAADEASKADAGGAARPSRIASELKGNLVDADGNPVDDAGVAGAKYYVIYSSAGWCGWCAKFNPTLVKWYEEVNAKYPGAVQAVYFGSDRSEQEMREHLRKAGLTFPAVKFDRRADVPSVLGLVSGGTPQVVVMTADGRVVHTGDPAGMTGANQALAALRRELAKAARS